MDREDNQKERRKPGGGAAIQYHLNVGKEQIQYAQDSHHAAATHMPKSALQYVSFFGKCYQCKYSAHSQKYCPLRQCQRCKQYGHSESVCWTLATAPPLAKCHPCHPAARRPASSPIRSPGKVTYASKVRDPGTWRASGGTRPHRSDSRPSSARPPAASRQSAAPARGAIETASCRPAAPGPGRS